MKWGGLLLVGGCWGAEGGRRLQRCTLWPFGGKHDGGGADSGFSSFSAAFIVQLSVAAAFVCVRLGLNG